MVCVACSVSQVTQPQDQSSTLYVQSSTCQTLVHVHMYNVIYTYAVQVIPTCTCIQRTTKEKHMYMLFHFLPVLCLSICLSVCLTSSVSSALSFWVIMAIQTSCSPSLPFTALKGAGHQCRGKIHLTSRGVLVEPSIVARLRVSVCAHIRVSVWPQIYSQSILPALYCSLPHLILTSRYMYLLFGCALRR